MLHDVGKLILASQLPDQFRRVLEAGAGRSASFQEVERELLGVSHAEVGAYLLGLWGMPYPVVEAVAHHHKPRSVADQRGLGVLAAVHVAEALAHEATDGDPAPTSLDVQYLAGLGLTDRLDGWRELARSEAAGGREAA